MYFAQLMIWMFIVCLSKFFLYFFQKAFAESLETLGILLLSPVKNNGKLKLIIVMIFIPLTFNAIQVNFLIQFWIQDNFLKYKPTEASMENISNKEKILDKNSKEESKIPEKSDIEISKA